MGRLGAFFLLSTLLMSPSGVAATSLSADACVESFISLSQGPKKSPLDQMRANINQRLKDFPSGLKKRSQKITDALKECFSSKTLTQAQKRAAQMNLAMNVMVPLTAISASHFYSVKEAKKNNEPAPDFPFDLVATSLTMNAWTSYIQCRNELLAPKDAGLNQAKGAKAFLRKKWDNYKRYLWMNTAGVGIYTGFIALEDGLRGEDIFSEEKMKVYAQEGLFGFVWDNATDIAHVLILDKVLLKYIPGGKAMLTQLIESKVISGVFKQAGTKKFLALQLKNWAAAPGVFLEFLVRQGYVSSRAFGYVQLRNSLFPPKGTPEEEEEIDKLLEDIKNLDGEEQSEAEEKPRFLPGRY